MSQPQYSTAYSRFHARARKPTFDPVYAGLIRQLNALDAIPEAKRTAAQRQERAQIKRRVDEIELRMASQGVQG